MSIGRHHLKQWLSNDLVERSCALNVVAHEITHTVSSSPNNFTYAVNDGAKRGNKMLPQASYLFGSVAQCSWLQMKGRVTAKGWQHA